MYIPGQEKRNKKHTISGRKSQNPCHGLRGLVNGFRFWKQSARKWHVGRLRENKGMCREPGACSMLSFQKQQSMQTSNDSYSTEYNGSFKITVVCSLQRSNQAISRGLLNSSNKSQGFYKLLKVLQQTVVFFIIKISTLFLKYKLSCGFIQQTKKKKNKLSFFSLPSRMNQLIKRLQRLVLASCWLGDRQERQALDLPFYSTIILQELS